MNILKHPMSVIKFRETFPDQSRFVEEELSKVPKAIISMPVKSGKRVVVQCEAAFDRGFGDVKHIFATSFKRNDCKEQMIEMELYGIKVFCGRELHGLPAHVMELIKDSKTPVIHFDESDFGTGDRQIANSVFTRLKDLPENGWEKLKIRAYSATNEEAIYSEFADLCTHLEPSMPSTFRHAPWFIANGMVEEAVEFWDSDSEQFSEQANGALQAWLKDDKPFAVVRFAASRGNRQTTYGDVKRSTAFRDKLNAMGVNFIKFIDNKNPFYWGKDWKNPDGWGAIDKNKKMLLVVNQTCIRSTEIGFHPLISFWHDNRGATTPYSTCAQAMFRVNHFDYPENPEAWASPKVNIKIFGCRSTFRLAAGEITAEQYAAISGRQLSMRVKENSSRLSRSPDHFQTFESEDQDEFISHLAKEWGRSTVKIEPDKDGVYKQTWRSITKKWMKADVDREMWSGLNEDIKFRRYVYYDDANKVKFWAIMHDGTVDNVEISSKKSMYNQLGPAQD
jgi:hypothetical protein